MAKWKIPEPIPIDWTMRTLDSAKLTVRELPDGRFEQTIEHTIGSTGKVLGPVSRFMRRRAMPMLVAWRRHNVEEAGNLPMFLPELCAERVR
jgi:hypothetical protein